MHACNEETAVFMAASLLKHARAIHNYAATYCVPTAGNAYIDEESRQAFVRNLERMRKEMYALMLMARYKGVNRHCNTEQIEAYMDATAALVSGPETAPAPLGLLN